MMTAKRRSVRALAPPPDRSMTVVQYAIAAVIMVVAILLPSLA